VATGDVSSFNTLIETSSVYSMLTSIKKSNGHFIGSKYYKLIANVNVSQYIHKGKNTI